MWSAVHRCAALPEGIGDHTQSWIPLLTITNHTLHDNTATPVFCPRVRGWSVCFQYYSHPTLHATYMQYIFFLPRTSLRLHTPFVAPTTVKYVLLAHSVCFLFQQVVDYHVYCHRRSSGARQSAPLSHLPGPSAPAPQTPHTIRTSCQ